MATVSNSKSPLLPTESNFTPQTPASAPTTPERQAAEKLANFMSVAYGGEHSGWNDATLKEVAENGKFTNEKTGKVTTVPKDIQDAAKTLVAAGGIALVDANKDGFGFMGELWSYADKGAIG